jgi:hypothetical protein
MPVSIYIVSTHMVRMKIPAIKSNARCFRGGLDQKEVLTQKSGIRVNSRGKYKL